ncbi:hypothetical protein [Archaeoglobus sp.]
MKCVGCGRELREEDEGITWRRCSICKNPVCFDCIRYIGTWVRGLYKNFINVIPVCPNCLPKSMLKRLAEKKLKEE